jgi:hypothetical protein
MIGFLMQFKYGSIANTSCLYRRVLGDRGGARLSSKSIESNNRY